MRAEPGDAALEVSLQPLLERPPRRRLAFVAKLGGGEAELAGTLGERRPIDFFLNGASA